MSTVVLKVGGASTGGVGEAVAALGKLDLLINNAGPPGSLQPIEFADLDALTRAVAMVREIADTKPMRKMWTAEEAPGTYLRTDAELRDFVRRDVTTIYHPVGTCAMSGQSQLDASRLAGVVDTELRVRGVSGLRVVDASVMPTVPRGNTNAPIMMIAERAAQRILLG